VEASANNLRYPLRFISCGVTSFIRYIAERDKGTPRKIFQRLIPVYKQFPSWSTMRGERGILSHFALA
jgi:hypothetical protein